MRYTAFLLGWLLQKMRDDRKDMIYSQEPEDKMEEE